MQAQDYEHWECRVVDDHSTDESAALVQSFAERDARIFLHNNAGMGIIDALQTGMAYTQGNAISRFDADDVMPEGRLELLAQALQESKPGTVVTGMVQYFAEYPITPGYQRYENWLNTVNKEGKHRQNMYRECVIASPNWLLRRDDFERAGGFANLEYPEDYDVTLRWYAAGYAFKVLPEVTLLWREHSMRTSRNAAEYKQKAFFELKIKRFLQIEKGEVPLVLWGTGQKGKLAAKILRRHQVSFYWIGQHPEKYPHGLHEVPVYSHQKIAELTMPQVLVAVYPPALERERIENFLKSLALREGKHYWYL